MMDPLTGLNRGYAFVTFCTKEAAQEAVKLVSLLTWILTVFLFFLKNTSKIISSCPDPSA